MSKTRTEERLLFASVVLEINLQKTLTYRVPQEMQSILKKGMMVKVPLRGRSCTGLVVETSETSDYPKAFPIQEIMDEEFYLSSELFDLALWISKYYATPLSKVFKTIVPTTIRKEVKAKEQLFVVRKKGVEELRELCSEIRGKHPAQASVLDVLLNAHKGVYLSELMSDAGCTRSPIDTLVRKGFLGLETVHVERSPLEGVEFIRSQKKILNDEQKVAYDRIVENLKTSTYQTHLLYGVTGSGKTEVYLQAIDEALKLGKSSIVLVPEIALTTQTIERFRSRFEGHIAVLHHRLSPGEKRDEWHRIHRGEAKIIIGARSAIFCPAKNLGLIIIDEEQEQSFKQSDEMPCYHARDVAVMRGTLANATVVLGSATPSFESYHNAQKGKFLLSTLSSRADTAQRPTVKIVNMREEYEKAKGYTLLSQAILEGIKTRFDKGEQTILFLNKRGYHSSLTCEACGEAVRCKQCDLTLTYHKGQNALRCHLCDERLCPPPRTCPSCRSSDTLKFRGSGTELVEKSLNAILPDVRTLRIDADTTRHKGSHQKLFRDFKNGKADVLIGTQMVAKGLHFPQVTLVGVLNCDTALNIPDFRASETAFQLMTQVAGRAGRGEFPGEVVFQTLIPDNSTIQHASHQDYDDFYQEESVVREMFHYPPFARLIKVMLSGKDEALVVEKGEAVRAYLIHHLPPSVEIYPFVPCGYSKIKDNYRYQFLIKSPTPLTATRDDFTNLDKVVGSRKIRIRVDIDPTSTFL